MDVRAVSSQALEIAGGIRVFSKFFFSWWEANSNNSKKLGEKKETLWTYQCLCSPVALGLSGGMM